MQSTIKKQLRIVLPKESEAEIAAIAMDPVKAGDIIQKQVMGKKAN